MVGIHSWLIGHPITKDVLIMVLGLVLGPVVTKGVPFLWKLRAIPPQRLNVWILKARLSRAESRLHKLIGICKEPGRLTFECFLSLLYLGIALVFLIGTCFETLILPWRSGGQIAVLITGFVGYALTLLSVDFAKDIIGAVLVPTKQAEQFSAQIEKLKALVR
jgi:hypothetical protein